MKQAAGEGGWRGGPPSLELRKGGEPAAQTTFGQTPTCMCMMSALASSMMEIALASSSFVLFSVCFEGFPLETLVFSGLGPLNTSQTCVIIAFFDYETKITVKHVEKSLFLGRTRKHSFSSAICNFFAPKAHPC